MYSIEDLLNGNQEEIDDDDLNIIQEDNEAEETEEDTQNENDEVKKDDVEDKPVKKVRKQSQRPLLNAERLKGPRGLICMEKIFSDLKFRGSGHEQEDLETIMTSLQHWCHRLFPKYTFDDTLEHIEKLGTKKPVITLRKKIIMNMLQDEIFGMQPDPEEETQPVIQSEPATRQPDPFDLLLGENRQSFREIEPTPEIEELTDEQRERIAKNRLLATERRRAKFEAQAVTEVENTVEVSSQENVILETPMDE